MGCRLLTVSSLGGERELPLPVKAPVLWDRGSALMTPLNLNHPLQSLVSNTVTGGLEFGSMNLGRHKAHSSHPKQPPLRGFTCMTRTPAPQIAEDGAKGPDASHQSPFTWLQVGRNHLFCPTQKEGCSARWQLSPQRRPSSSPSPTTWSQFT